SISYPALTSYGCVAGEGGIRSLHAVSDRKTLSGGEPVNTPSTVQRLRTSGTLHLEEGDFDVENNVWIVGNDESAVVIDASHQYETIARGLGDRELMAIVATHGHSDHVNAAVDLADLTDCPILLHPDDTELWHQVHPGREPDAPLLHGEVLRAGDVEMQDRKSTRLNSSHVSISYAVFCLN